MHSDATGNARPIGRNAALIAVALLGLLSTLPGTPADAGMAAVVAVAGAVIGALVVMIDDLVALG